MGRASPATTEDTELEFPRSFFLPLAGEYCHQPNRSPAPPVSASKLNPWLGEGPQTPRLVIRVLNIFGLPDRKCTPHCTCPRVIALSLSSLRGGAQRFKHTPQAILLLFGEK